MIVRMAAGMRTVKQSRLSVASLRSRAPRRATHAVSGPTMNTVIPTRRMDSSRLLIGATASGSGD